MTTVDYLIVGAGPAGLQLAHHLQEAGRTYTVLEAGEGPGQYFRTYPRHRTLISINKPHTGTSDPELRLRMDWNSLLSTDPDLLFTRYSKEYFPSAEDLVRYLEDYATKLGLHVVYNARVSRIARTAGGFAVTAGSASWTARRVVLATGVSQENVPDIPGIELAERYSTMSVDPQDYVDQRVLVLGKGNSAFETADALVPTAAVIHVAGRSSVKLAWKTHYVGHLRAVNNNFLDTYQLKSQNALLDGNVLSIERQGTGYRVRFSFVRADEAVKELYYDRVLTCTGFRVDASVFDPDTMPELVIDDRFLALTPAYESVDVPGLYVAGTLMQQRDFKKSTSGFIHGFRYGVRALSRILQRRYDATDWPARAIGSSPQDLAAAVVERVNRTSALWQQFQVLGDVVVVDPGGTARYLEEVPVDYAHDEPFTADGDHVVVTLEYGPDHDKVDPFDITVNRTAQNDSTTAHDASYLHPVLRHYRAGVLVGTHHMAENLENEWTSPDAHVAPLEAFFAGVRRLEPVGGR